MKGTQVCAQLTFVKDDSKQRMLFLSTNLAIAGLLYPELAGSVCAFEKIGKMMIFPLDEFIA